MSVYLDYTATSPVTQEVLNIYSNQLQKNFANPASLHGLGHDAEKTLKESKKNISRLLGAVRAKLIITSGGSESINFALKGFFYANTRSPRRLIISRGEHPAVLKTAAFLEESGIELESVPLTSKGTVDLDVLQKALQKPAAMLSLIHVNNETGAVNQIKEIVSLRDRLQPDMVIHLDAVQSPGKIAVDFSRLGVDMLSGSGHKIGAPKGIGWLLVRKGLRLEPLIHGGGQQDNLRAGTENAPLAAALAAALELALEGLEAKIEKVKKVRHLYLSRLDEYGIRYEIVSPADGVPHILAIAFPGIKAETMLHALEGKQVYISAGSACSSRRRQKNPVLAAMKLNNELLESTVRISFAPDLSQDDIDQAARATYDSYKYLIKI